MRFLPRRYTVRDIPTLLEGASQSYRVGKRRKAARLYRKVLRLDEERVPALVNLGAILSETPGTLRKAAQLMERASELDPENRAVWLNMGTIYAQLQENDRAVEALTHLVEIDPDYPDLHYNLAHVYLRMGKTRDAFLEAQTELRSRPEHFHAQVLMELLKKALQEDRPPDQPKP